MPIRRSRVSRPARSERVLIANYCPPNPEGGPIFIRETIKALDGVTPAQTKRQKIYCGNALWLVSLDDYVEGSR